jgi:TrbL/VirB6 plasmid conjugal transfer protein
VTAAHQTAPARPALPRRGWTGWRRWPRRALAAVVAAGAVVGIVAGVLGGGAPAAGASPSRPHEGVNCDISWEDAASPIFEGYANADSFGDILTTYASQPVALIMGMFGSREVEVQSKPDGFDQGLYDRYVEEAKHEANEHDNCSLATHVPVGSCADIRHQQSMVVGDWLYGPPGRDLDNGLLPDECWGSYPTNSFTLHHQAATGWWFTNTQGIAEKFWVASTSLVYHLGRGAMQLCLATIAWAFLTFRIQEYEFLSILVGESYEKQIVGPFRLEDIAFMALIGYAAVTALRGRLAAAAGELAVALAALVLAAFLMANRGVYLHSTAETMDAGTAALLAAGQGQDPERGDIAVEAAVDPLTRRLHEEFIQLPWEHANWGRQITDMAQRNPDGSIDYAGQRDPCARRVGLILWVGDSDDSGWGARYMAEGDDDEVTDADRACVAAAQYMSAATGQRFLTVLVTTVVTISVAIVFGLCAVTLIVSKVLVLVLFAILPLAAAAVGLPGPNRRLAWGWVGALAQAFLAALGMSLVLAFFLLATKEVTERTQDFGLFKRWIVLFVIVVIVYLLRQRIVHSTRSAATSVTNTLTRTSPASVGAPAWSGVDRGVNMGSPGELAKGFAAWGGIGVTGAAATAWGRRANARLSRKNLRRMDRYREDRERMGGRPRRLPFNPAARLVRTTGHRVARALGTGGRRAIRGPARATPGVAAAPAAATAGARGAATGSVRPGRLRRVASAAGRPLLPRIDRITHRTGIDRFRDRAWDVRARAGARTADAWQRATFGGQRQAKREYAEVRSRVREIARSRGRRVTAGERQALVDRYDAARSARRQQAQAARAARRHPVPPRPEPGPAPSDRYPNLERAGTGQARAAYERDSQRGPAPGANMRAPRGFLGIRRAFEERNQRKGTSGPTRQAERRARKGAEQVERLRRSRAERVDRWTRRGPAPSTTDADRFEQMRAENAERERRWRGE